jgi:lysosomal Pro-X carboxypeptidase
VPFINETANSTGFQVNNLMKLQQAFNVFNNFTGDQQCLNLTGDSGGALDGSGWLVQTCNEFPMPQGDDPAVSCFTWQNWDEEAFTNFCNETYGLIPKYDWALDYFGGRNPSKDFESASNIVFMNGDLDPWHMGGINKNITENTVTIFIKDSAHHLDLRDSNPADPPEV